MSRLHMRALLAILSVGVIAVGAFSPVHWVAIIGTVGFIAVVIAEVG